MSLIGRRCEFAFELPKPIAHPDATEILLWIGGIQLHTSACYLPSFLQMAQRFIHLQQQYDDPALVQYLASLEDVHCLEHFESAASLGRIIGQIEPRKVLAAYGMHNLDELLTDYNVYVFDAPHDRKRILWSGRLDCKEFSREHAGVVRGTQVSRAAFFAPFHGLFSECGARIEYGTNDWIAWDRRYSTGIG